MTRPPQPALPSILLIDDNEPLRDALARGFAAKGVSVSTASSFSAAAILTRRSLPSFVASEIRIGSHTLFDYLREVSALLPPHRVAVVTAYPSIATAVRCTKIGLAAYVPKPISACDLLKELAERPEPEGQDDETTTTWPSLDRTIWEYIHRVHCSAGSISEAARRLGLHRRSLRRMLSKYPPAR